MFKLLAIRRHRPPVRFNRRTRGWRISRFPMNSAADAEPAPSTPRSATQVDLFAAVDMPIMEFTLRSKFSSSQRRKKKKTRGLQYKIQFWRGIQGKDRERKFTVQTRDSDQSNDFDWDDATIHRIAMLLVDRSFEEVFNLEQKGSTRIAEIVAWVNRRFDEVSPFNFEACCAIAGYRADELREMFFARLKRKHESTFPHYSVLRNGIIDAEHGDPDAIEWVLSDADAPMTFRDCCNALGFEHDKARTVLLLPIVTHDDGVHDNDEESLDVTADFHAAPVAACG